MRYKAIGQMEKLYDKHHLGYLKKKHTIYTKAEMKNQEILKQKLKQQRQDKQFYPDANSEVEEVQECEHITQRKNMQNFKKEENKINRDFARKLKPDLHNKTHFKAAMSILMKDSNIMNLDDGAANEIIKSTLNARKPEKEIKNPLCQKLESHFEKKVKALKNQKILQGGPYPMLNTGSGPALDPETGGRQRI